MIAAPQYRNPHLYGSAVVGCGGAGVIAIAVVPDFNPPYPYEDINRNPAVFMSPRVKQKLIPPDPEFNATSVKIPLPYEAIRTSQPNAFSQRA